MQSVVAEQLYEDFDSNAAWAQDAFDEHVVAPVLPAILLNAAFALALVGGTFCLTRFVLEGTLLTSSVITGLTMLLSFIPLGVLSARLTGTPVLASNLGWGCGVLVMTLLFFGLCGLSGAVAALLVRAAGLTVR